MTRWFTRVAVFAAWLGLGSLAHAQGGFPSPVGAARLPEPLHYVPNQPPTPMVAGPLNPLMAPAGPPESLNLPAGHTSAFMLDHYPPEAAFYASVGLMGLQRQGQSSLPIAYSHAQNITTTALPHNTTRIESAVTFPPGELGPQLGIDTGNFPIGIFPSVLNLRQTDPNMALGTRASVGYLFANEAFELTGFYVPTAKASATVGGQGLLFVPFGLNLPIPLGFEGNNNLWLQADVVRARYTGGVASAEANYRRWNLGVNDLELLVGVRYFYNQERVDIYTDDEFYVRDVFNHPDPTRAANYTAGVRNNHLGVQIGFEYGCPIPVPFLQNSVWMIGQGKTSLGPNFIERSWRLVRGDGYEGVNRHENTILLGNVSEVTGCLDFHLMERLRLRAGYTFILALGFASPGAQIDFNLNTQGQRGTNSDSTFWHGPIGELQFLF